LPEQHPPAVPASVAAGGSRSAGHYAYFCQEISIVSPDYLKNPDIFICPMGRGSVYNIFPQKVKVRDRKCSERL